jgi:hypothetical protein
LILGVHFVPCLQINLAKALPPEAPSQDYDNVSPILLTCGLVV